MNGLRRRWKRMRNVPGLGKNLLAVTGGVLVGILVLTYVLANQKFIGPWEDRMELTADFTSADALDETASASVRIAGVEVGQVTDIELVDGLARVTMSLEPGHEVHADSMALLRPKSVLNEMYIELSPGSEAADVLRDGDGIPQTQTARPVQVDEVFSDLDQRTRDALGDLLEMSDVGLANAPENLPKALESFNGAERTFAPLLDKLATRRENIARLVSALSLVAEATGDNRDRTARLATSLRDTLGTLSANQNDLVAGLRQVPGLGEDLREAMGSVGSLATELNPALDNIREASTTLPPTLRRLDSTVRNVTRTAEAAEPVVAKARPLLSLLGPVISDVRTSISDIEPLSGRVDPLLDVLVPQLGDLQAFLYNTSAVFTASDATGGMIRGHVTAPLPFGAVVPGTNGGNPSPLENRSPR